MDELVPVDAHYSEWMAVEHLSMPPELAGAEHIFSFEGASITIRLPDIPPDEPPDQWSTAHIQIRRTDTKQIVEIVIHAVMVVINDLHFGIPIQAAEHPGIDSRLYSKEKLDEIDGSANSFWRLTRRALGYWLRVVRWRTKDALIDQARYVQESFGFGGRLFNCATGRAFFNPSIQRTIIVSGSHRLTTDEWLAIANDLCQNTFPPIWNEYLMSGRQRVEAGDFIAATIDFAVAIEVVVRSGIDKRLPAAMPQGARDAIFKMNMAEVIRRWDELDMPAKAGIPVFSDMARLVEVRNAIMHRGMDARVTKDFCNKVSIATEAIINAINPS